MICPLSPRRCGHYGVDSGCWEEPFVWADEAQMFGPSKRYTAALDAFFVAFAERHGLGGVPGASYQMILGDAPNDDIRRMLDGWLPPKLTAIKRRAYSIAYLRRVREGGKGEAQRAGRLAQSAWMKNFYDALRRNAKVRGILPAGWTPPVGGRHGTQAAGEEKEG